MIIQPIPHDGAEVYARLQVQRQFLPALNYATLEALVDRRGRVVPPSELWAALYPGSVPYVQARDHGVMRQRIFLLRRGLGLASDVVTVPAFGYTILRFDGIFLAEAEGLVVRRRDHTERYRTDLSALAGDFERAFALAGAR